MEFKVAKFYDGRMVKMSYFKELLDIEFAPAVISYLEDATSFIVRLDLPSKRCIMVRLSDDYFEKFTTFQIYKSVVEELKFALIREALTRN
mgnify:CR=1 FL=1